MARIPDEELERIKREVFTAELARALGIELRPYGANLMGLCPFHDDHDPSFVVTPSSNLWHCLGACQRGGSNIDLLMRAEKLSFREAALRLRERLTPFFSRFWGRHSEHCSCIVARRRCRRRNAHERGRAFLPRDLEAEPRSAGLSRKPWPALRRAGREKTKKDAHPNR